MSINYQNIFEKGLLVSLSLRGWCGKSWISDELLKDLPTEIIKGRMDLLMEEDKNFFLEIKKTDLSVISEVKKITIPFPIEGVYFVLEKNVNQLVQLVEKRKEARKKSIEAVVEKYEEGKKRFAEKYPEFYKSAVKCGKYPSKEALRERFKFEFKLFQISIPSSDSLKGIDSGILKVEMDKFKNDISEMKKEVANIICNELLMKAETLKKQSLGDSKPNQKTLNSLNEFFETISGLYSDFVDRKDVLKAVNKFKNTVGTTTAEDLRFDENFKAKFGEKIEEVAKTIQALPNIKHKRAIEF